MASLRPSLSSSPSTMSGVPSPSQSGSGGGVAAVVVEGVVVVVVGAAVPGVVGTGPEGPTGADPAGRTIGERDFFVAGPRTFVKTAIWKRVAWPFTRNFVTTAGTTTSMRDFVALRGRTRTLLPSLAREKKMRLCDAPEAKFFPFSTSTPPTGTCAGEIDVTVGLRVVADAAPARAQTARSARTEVANRRRTKTGIRHSSHVFNQN